MGLPSPDRLAKLKDSILETGFPLELEIDEALIARGYYTSPNIHYLDDETGKVREVDNYALFPDAKASLLGLDPIPFSPHIVVECKRLGDVSVVVFRRNRPVVTHYDFEGQMYDFPYLIQHRARTSNMLAEFHLGWLISNCGLHYSQFSPRIGIAKGIKPGSRSLDEEEEKQRDAVYSGLMQLVKAQIHDAKSSIARDKEVKGTYYPFFFSFLVFVVDGEVVEAQRNGKDLALQPVDHAVARTSYKASYDDNFQGYLVDVVTRDYFPQYLTVLESDVARLYSALRTDKSRLTEYMKRPSNVY